MPSRLIGSQLVVRVRAETVEGDVGTTLVITLPRLQGRQQHAINYRHVIWSLVRKPGAFAAYRYRDELFPSLAFRQAYDQLQQECPKRADREYLPLLQRAATTSETEVETALVLLAEAGRVPSFDTVRDLVALPQIPEVSTPRVQREPYDQLLPSRRAAHG